MPSVTYKPQAGDSDQTSAFGYFFEAGKGTDVPEGPALDKLKNNPSFQVAGAKPEAEDKSREQSAERLDKAIDGRTRQARERREKADAAEADAAAAERAAAQATALREAQNGVDGPETAFLTNR